MFENTYGPTDRLSKFESKLACDTKRKCPGVLFLKRSVPTEFLKF